MKASPLLLAGALVCNTLAAQVKPVDPPSNIPLLPEASLSDPSWADRGFRVEVLPVLTGKPESTPRLSVAWTKEGLLTCLRSNDTTPVEAEDPLQLWSADSLEIFVSSAYDSRDLIQIIVTPGRGSETAQPRVQIIDPRKDKPALVDPVVHSEVHEQGYTLSCLVPWANFQTPPSADGIIGLQYIVNDKSGSGWNRRSWFPGQGATRRPHLMYPVRLSETPSPPEIARASFEVKHYKDLVLAVRGSREAAGLPVRIDAAGKTLKAGTMAAAEPEGSILRFTLPPAFLPEEGAPVTVTLGEQRLRATEVPSLAKARRDFLASAQIAAKPFVFHGGSFPRIDFVHPTYVEMVLGEYDMRVRYFDEAYNEVTTPSKPGRYGALIDVETRDGLSHQWKLTLFRTAKKFQRNLDPYKVSLGFPEAFGVSQETVNDEAVQVGEITSSKLHSLSDTDSTWAVLLSALYETQRDPDRFRGLESRAIDRDWWHGLAKKLGTAKPYLYKVYLPEGYDSDESKRWPLLLFLHGLGERGDDLKNVETYGPPKLITDGEKLPFVVVAPIVPRDEWGWVTPRLIELLDEVESQYRIDTDREYVTGLSMGGFGTWNLAAQHAKRFAAIAPICGGAYPGTAARLGDLPVWTFHGDADAVVSIRMTEWVVDALKKAGKPVKFTVYPGVGHDSWTETYNNPELFEWFLQHKKR
jgi:predicted esterase